MYAQLTYFDGPFTPEQVAARKRADRERIIPAVRADPRTAAGLVANYVLDRPDGGAVVITIVKSRQVLEDGRDVILGSELLPGEDPALLPGPDRVEFLPVSAVVDPELGYTEPDQG